jgi:UDP-glucose 4-epimerase
MSAPLSEFTPMYSLSVPLLPASDFSILPLVADAHICALDALAAGSGGSGGGAEVNGLVLNVGTGEGSSVQEVIDAIGRVLGRPVGAQVVARRPGDPAALVAKVDRIADVLGWTASRNLDDMVASAWEGWVALHPEAASLAT